MLCYGRTATALPLIARPAWHPIHDDAATTTTTGAFGWVGAAYVEAPAAVGRSLVQTPPLTRMGPCTDAGYPPFRLLPASCSIHCRRESRAVAVARAALVFRMPGLVGFRKMP
ncbi:hypothetical protein ZWY2020_030746 [Hordeum vulgare]|nr:hypothetical protein ZWY2020_030746 [Hordeum vulgare]